jgi:hypothetical protein
MNNWFPKVFQPDQGFGFNGLLTLWLDYPFRLFCKVLVTLGLSWFVIEKILWLSVFALAVYSSYRLARYVLGTNSFLFLASLVYAANTYILLLFSGGQLGVALAYGLAPLVLMKFIQMIDGTNERVLRLGLWLALLLSFDLRFVYLILVSAGMYYVSRSKVSIASILKIFVIPVCITAIVHAFWILPTVLASRGAASLGEDFNNAGMLRFLSFADFSHSLSLLHPNWPENLFGKVYFLQPEFLVLPILAFLSLLFVSKNKDKIVFFALLALAGAFLSKGVQNPFGMIFEWMFVHVPGFVMFRDPTKFYLFTAIGYSILIPYSLSKIRTRFREAIIILFIIFWFFTIRGVFTGSVKGNFRPSILTSEYIRLKEMLSSDRVPSRVLWIPQKDTFAYSSEIHPLLTLNQLSPGASVSAVVTISQTPEFKRRLVEAGVGYVVVPQDLEKRIFLNDYHFDSSERSKLVDSLSSSGLKRVTGYAGLAVFTNDDITWKSIIPDIVKTQQKLTNIGFAVSITALSVICLLAYLY